MSRFRDVAWLAAYLALAFVLLMPLALHMETQLPDDGDSVLGLWIIWWGATHLDMGYPGILEANAYFPHKGALLYSEPMLSQALLSWPLFNLLDNPVLAANLLTWITLGLSAFCGHLLFREFTGSDASAAVGAVSYAFCSFNLSQIPRVQLISLQWLPLALLCLHRFFYRDKKSYLPAFVLFSVLHGLACFYYLAFYAIILAVLVPTYFFTCRTWEKKAATLWLAASGGFIGVIFLFVARPFLELYRHYGFAGIPTSFDLARYFQPPYGNPLYAFLANGPHLVDYFLGYIALPVALFGLWRFARSNSESRTTTIACAFFVLGVLGFVFSGGPDLIFNGSPVGPGPYQIVQKVGPFANLRDPDRFSLLLRLALSLFVAKAANDFFARSRGYRRALGCTVLAVVLLSEQWSPRYAQGTEIPAVEKVPDVYAWLTTRQDRGALAELPVLPFRFVRFNTMEAYFSTFHQRPILFNKPSFYPPAMEYLRWELRNFPDDSSTTLLRAIGVRTVVVHPKRWGSPRQQSRRLRHLQVRGSDFPLLRKFPDRDFPVWNDYRLGGEQLHAVKPMSEEGLPRDCQCRLVDRAEYELEGSGSSDPRWATDGDRTTKWTTGTTQEEGDFLDIVFDRPRRPARIEIEMSFPYEEFARNLEFNGYRDTDMRRVQQVEDIWYKVGLIRQLIEDPFKARLRYDLEPPTVERLRLFIHQTEPGSQPWSVSEIHVYELDEESQRSE